MELVKDNTGQSTNRRTILAVDDEPMLLRVLIEALEDSDYRVLQAQTGEEAVLLLQHRAAEVDLLVTDIRLPGQIDGWGIAEEARRLKPAMPVIYVTGFFSQSHREVPGGIMIRKPYRPSTIIDTAVGLWSDG